MGCLYLENRMISQIGYIPWAKCRNDTSAPTREYAAANQGQERILEELAQLLRQGLLLTDLAVCSFIYTLLSIMHR